MVLDLIISNLRMSGFISFPLFGFTLAIKLRNFEFESHLNTLIFFDKKRYDVRFKYVPKRNMRFCLFANFFFFFFWIHFSHIKLKDFDFESH